MSIIQYIKEIGQPDMGVTIRVIKGGLSVLIIQKRNLTIKLPFKINPTDIKSQGGYRKVADICFDNIVVIHIAEIISPIQLKIIVFELEQRFKRQFNMQTYTGLEIIFGS